MYRRILVPVKNCPCSASAAHHAIRLARHLGSRITFLHVYREGDDLQAAKHMLEQISQHTRSPAKIHLEPCNGSSPADVIVDYAAHDKADLIILGAHAGHRSALGPVAEKVSGRATVPVQIIPHPSRATEVVETWARVEMPN